MTASRKVFMAAALLAAGFLVAKLSGEPAARHRRASDELAVANHSAVQQTPSVSPSAPLLAPGVRLVPDFTGAGSDKQEAGRLLTAVAPPPFESPNPHLVDRATTQPAELAEEPLAGVRAHQAPRAQLRNEAPRPLEFGSRAFAVPDTTPARLAPAADEAPRTASTDWGPAATRPAGFAQSSETTPTIRASYNASVESPRSPSMAAPSRPSPAEHHQPRTHIVTDGDSLARLAGRYLDDPLRGNEIYEANRGMLAAPDLLPIGAELVIPSRVGNSPVDHPPQSMAPRTLASRTPTSRTLVPVRPVPSYSAVAPRAQLARPRPVE